MSTLTITAKGQITLKRDLLRHMKVSPGERVEVEKLPDGRLVLGPPTQTGSIADFSGCLANNKGPRLTIEQIKEATERAWAGER